jgi:hypothetical protein
MPAALNCDVVDVMVLEAAVDFIRATGGHWECGSGNVWVRLAPYFPQTSSGQFVGLSIPLPVSITDHEPYAVVVDLNTYGTWIRQRNVG